MAGEKEQDLESNSDIEDMRIKPTDNMVLVGHVEGNASILEVYGKLHDFQDLVNPRIVKNIKLTDFLILLNEKIFMLFSV